MARKELIFFWESPLFSATQLKRRVWCLQPQQLPSSQQQQQRQATMAKFVASPAKMLKVLPPVLDKPAASAGADEVVAQDVVVQEVAAVRQL
ncbi:hypothetical protein PF008_g33048, partial [Phytophthora fragariae]